MAGEAGARKESQAASAPDRELPPFEFPSGPFDQLRSWSRTFMPLDPVLGASMARNLYFLGTAAWGESSPGSPCHRWRVHPSPCWSRRSLDEHEQTTRNL